MILSRYDPKHREYFMQVANNMQKSQPADYFNDKIVSVDLVNGRVVEYMIVKPEIRMVREEFGTIIKDSFGTHRREISIWDEIKTHLMSFGLPVKELLWFEDPNNPVAHWTNEAHKAIIKLMEAFGVNKET
jgi:hypothetical protein